jgi:branched-chain amino acid transport system ATP-binding protein
MRLRVSHRDASPTAAAPSDGAILSVRGVTARYGPTVAIRDVSFDIARGETVTILGANGAGKTTTLRTIVGLLAPATGHIWFDGRDITKRSTEAIVKCGIAMSPEGREVFGRLTVDENLKIGCGMHLQGRYVERRAYVLELFPVLHKKLHVYAGYLSGGEQQQVAIARALMSDPKLLLLDEPSLGLAPIIVEAVFELITKLRTLGVTILLVEQNADRALEIADRAYVLNTGRIELSGAAEELRANPAIEEAYLGVGSF